MPLTLRLIEASDVPDVQALYDATPETFRRLIGRPAPPDQAANDYRQATETPGRYQYAVMLDEQLVGLADCKLDDEVEGTAHIGLLLLRPPYDDPTISELVVRILIRWLEALGAHSVQVGVLAHIPDEIAFWDRQGFAFTGEQYRREFPGYAPRILVMERDIAPRSP